MEDQQHIIVIIQYELVKNKSYYTYTTSVILKYQTGYLMNSIYNE